MIKQKEDLFSILGIKANYKRKQKEQCLHII